MGTRTAHEGAGQLNEALTDNQGRSDIGHRARKSRAMTLRSQINGETGAF
jgi:hypothetical protein